MQRQDDTSLRGADSRNGKGAVRYLFLMRCWNCMQRACQWYKISENDFTTFGLANFSYSLHFDFSLGPWAAWPEIVKSIPTFFLKKLPKTKSQLPLLKKWHISKSQSWNIFGLHLWENLRPRPFIKAQYGLTGQGYSDK